MNETRVLLVDDNIDMLAIMKKALVKMGGMEVRTESNSRQALHTACQFVPDIIVLDINMPGMDGGDVASALHADPRTRDIPLIFLTSLSTPEEAAARQNLQGCTKEYLVAKPVNAAVLLGHLEKCLGRKICGITPLDE